MHFAKVCFDNSTKAQPKLATPKRNNISVSGLNDAPDDKGADEIQPTEITLPGSPPSSGAAGPKCEPADNTAGAASYGTEGLWQPLPKEDTAARWDSETKVKRRQKPEKIKVRKGLRNQKDKTKNGLGQSTKPES